MDTDKKRIVVIGNGAAGSQFIAKIAKCRDFNITVVTPFSYSEISVNMTKVIAVGPTEHIKSIFPLLKEDNVEYIIDHCVSLSSTEVTMATGRVLPFDVCVVATGQNMNIFCPNISEPLFQQRKDEIGSIFSKLNSAQTVVIGGGGAVGTELAADIKLRHKQKRYFVLFCL